MVEAWSSAAVMQIDVLIQAISAITVPFRETVMRLHLIFISCICLFLASCNTPPVKPEPLLALSPSQIKQLQNYDELVGLYMKLSQGLAGKAEADYPEDYAALAQIEAQIIELKKAELSSQFAEVRLDSGVVPEKRLMLLETALTESAPLPAEKWASVLNLIGVEQERTANYVAELEGKLSETEGVDSKVALYDELYTVTRDDKWQTQRDDIVEGLLADIREAAASEELDEGIQEKITIVKSYLGEDAVLIDELVGVDAKIYEKRFFDTVGQGQADEAYNILVQMSEANDFDAIKGKLAPTSQKMADYFTALADDSVKSPENLSQSFRWYSQAKEVNAILGVPAAAPSSYATLGDQLYGRYGALDGEGESAAGLAYLYAIKTFQPNRSGLRKTLSAQETKVRELAVKRLSTTDFQSPYKDQDYGDVISSFITQYLFEHVPHDVRIVEREQYEAILRERSLSGDDSALSSVNLLVSGSVLESKVESKEAKNKKMMRVEVGKETIPNPNYISWLEMSSKDRKTVEKPSETMDVAKFENISVGVTRHRKTGIFSVSYRLVEASTGRVIFPDSVTVNSEYEDESSEGVEMGEFVIPFKLADLPSDVEILDGLAKEIAAKIGEKLVDELKDQELKYLSAAEEAKADNDCAGEVTSLGNALMIMQLKEQDTNKVQSNYKNNAVACFN